MLKLYLPETELITNPGRFQPLFNAAATNLAAERAVVKHRPMQFVLSTLTSAVLVSRMSSPGPGGVPFFVTSPAWLMTSSAAEGQSSLTSRTTERNSRERDRASCFAGTINDLPVDGACDASSDQFNISTSSVSLRNDK